MLPRVAGYFKSISKATVTLKLKPDKAQKEMVTGQFHEAH